MIPLYGLVQDVFILETSTGKTKRTYCIQHAHALMRAHIDLHGEIPRIRATDEDTCALCDARALYSFNRMTEIKAELESTPGLTAEQTSEGWCAVDVAGGVWRPHFEASLEIEASENPELTVLLIASNEPMRGRWSQ